MYTWIVYDISKNRTRRKVANLCRKLGLQRVQKSVFLGQAKKSSLKFFKREVKQLLNLQTDSLFVVPMSKGEYKRIQRIGKTVEIFLKSRESSVWFI